jgi:nitroreductase
MELTTVMQTRRSVRKFKDAPVPREALEQMLDAARIAPSGKNKQNWHFIVIQNKELIEKVRAAVMDVNEGIAARMEAASPEKADAFRARGRANTAIFANAPVLIVVMTYAPLPSGYPEQEMVGEPADVLALLHMRSPGMQSLGAGVDHFALKCAELGYGSCWMTGTNYAGPAVEKLMREEAGFNKDGYFMGALLAVGVPEKVPSPTPRKALEEIYTYIE